MYRFGALFNSNLRLPMFYGSYCSPTRTYDIYYIYYIIYTKLVKIIIIISKQKTPVQENMILQVKTLKGFKN